MKAKLIILSLLIITGAGAQEKWSLRQCIDYAIEHNIEVKQQEVSRDLQKVELNTAKYSRLPSLNGSVGQSFGFGRTTSPIDNSYINMNTTGTSFGLSTDIPLFTGLQIPNNIALAKLNLKAATEDLNKAKEDISIQVTSAFLQVLFNEELCKVAAQQVELSKEQYNRMQRMNEVGKASTAELYEAKSRLAQDELSAVQAENNRQLALLDLSQLLELPSPEGFAVLSPQSVPDFSPLTSPEEVYNMAIMTKPGIIAAQYRLEGSLKSIRIAQSSFYPQLSFGAGINTGFNTISGQDHNSFGTQLNDNLYKSIGLTLSIPIFNRLSTRNRVKTAKLQHFNQSLQLDNAKKGLYKEIQQAYYNAVAAQAKYSSSGSAMEAAQESFRLMSEKYEQEKATAVEYNEAKTNLLKSTSDQIQAKFDYLFRTKILDFYKGEPLNLK